MMTFGSLKKYHNSFNLIFQVLKLFFPTKTNKIYCEMENCTQVGKE
jgi:hypothetical protein